MLEKTIQSEEPKKNADASTSDIPLGYFTFQLHRGLKLHFTSKDYDYTKYGGKIRGCTLKTFNSYSGKYFYQRFEQIYRKQDIPKFILANLLVNPGFFADKLLTPEAKTIFLNYLGRNESLREQFKKDVSYLFPKGEQHTNEYIDEILCDIPSLKGSSPKIVADAITGRISQEGLIILDEIVGLFDKLETLKIGEVNPVWEPFSFRMKRYQNFVDTSDMESFVGIINNTLGRPRYIFNA